MSNPLPTILSVIIVGLGVAVAWEAREISTLQRRLRESESKAAATQAQATEVAEVREHNEALKAESATLRQRLADAGGEAPAAEASAKPKEPKANWAESVGKMFTDPEMKKVMRQQQAMGMRMMYGDLIKQLGLSSEAGDQLMELLADRQMETTAKSMQLMNGKSDPKAWAEAGKATQEARDSFDGKLKELLGADGFNQLGDYEKTVGDRMIMQQYQQLMGGQSLPDAQRDQLLQIMIDERTKAPATPFDPSNKDVAAQLDLMQSDQALHDFLARQDAINQRVYDRAAQILTPEQLTSFKKVQQQMADMQVAGMKMGRSMMQKK